MPRALRSLLPEAFLRESEALGLNLFALLPRERVCIQLPEEARSLLLLGSSGGRFFGGFLAAGRGGPDPLDGYTAELVEALCSRWLSASLVEVFYPFRPPFLPFRRLAEEAGLGSPGPFGVLVHPERGPWFGLRAALALRLSAGPGASASSLAGVCAACPAPCLAACPGGAARREGLDIEACGRARRGLAECEARCAAREACPIGVAWRYPREEIEYHHRAASAFFG